MKDLKTWLAEYNLQDVNMDLISTSLTHSSYKGMVLGEKDNERLEFIGDAVLDLINAELLYNNESLSEGQMTEMRKTYVSNRQQAIIFEQIGMENYIKTANGLSITTKIKASFIEALFGAIFVDKDYNACMKFWESISQKLNLEVMNIGLKNAKSILQEFSQEFQFELPEYKQINRYGPDHNPIFIVKLELKPGNNRTKYNSIFNLSIDSNDIISETGEGSKIKIAEMNAAERLCTRLGFEFLKD